MLAALLLNLPRRGMWPYPRRVWDEAKAEAQDELTRFKALDEPSKKAIVKKAVNALEKTTIAVEEIEDAKEAASAYDGTKELLLRIENLELVLIGYFMLISRKNRNITAMLTLGVI